MRSSGSGFSSSNTRQAKLTQPDSLVKLVEMAQRASVHPLIRETAKIIVRDCASRDDMCELSAVFNAVKYGDSGVAPLRRGFKYIADPRWADYFTSPVDLLNNCLKGGCGGDCLPAETRLLDSTGRFVAIGDVMVGETIMGDGRWVTVTQKWSKGRQDILVFTLDNGCQLRCTPEHKLFVVSGGESRENVVEVRAGEVRAGDCLLTPASLPMSSAAADAVTQAATAPERAGWFRDFVEGLDFSAPPDAHTYGPSEEVTRKMLERIDAAGFFDAASEEEACRYRLALRLFGRAARVARAGDFYRVTPMRGDAFARVQAVEAGTPTETFDIEVDGHRFYLPETDAVVHNCDDHTMLLMSLCAALGWRMGARAWGRDSSGFAHVYAVAAYPKRPPCERVVGMDTTVPEADLGWEPPKANVLTGWME